MTVDIRKAIVPKTDPAAASSNARLHLMALLVLAVVTTFQVSLTQPLRDPFQEGEYAVFGFLAHSQADFRMPVLIHGGLQVVPSLVAAVSCSPDTQLVCVRTVNALIELGSGAVFLTVLAILTGLGTWAAVVASLPAAALLWLCNGPVFSAVVSHQYSPSIRDLFVLVGLLVMARACKRLDRGDAKDGSLSLLAIGGLAGIGLFWAYNRGLVFALVAGAFALGLCLLRRSPRPVLLVGAGGAAGLAAMLGVGGIGLMTSTLFNVEYWGQNQVIWRTPFDMRYLPFVVALASLTVVGGLTVGWRSLRAKRPGRAVMLATLVTIYALYLVQCLNRPDLTHLRQSMWPAMLILAIVIEEWMTRTRAAQAPRIPATLAGSLLLIGACVEISSSNSILHIVLGGLADNAVAATRPIPSDRDLGGRDMTRIANLIAASGRCTFVANNAIFIYLLSRMPPCSRFSAAVYVAPDWQAEVINELEATRPEIIVWESAAFYSSIDGRSIRDRTPELADWIEAHYPVRTAIGPHILLSRLPLPP
jgi:hypothetical protein